MSERWIAELLDARLNSLGELPRVRGGSLDWSIFRDVIGAGQLQLTRAPEPDIDWLSCRVRIWWEHGQRIAVGTYLPAIPGDEQDGPVERFDVALSDLSLALTSVVGKWLTYPVGTVVTDKVAAILKARGLTGSITASTDKLTTALTWEPEDTWLKVANDLLAAVGYDSLLIDPMGRAIVEPYTEPDQRPVVATYGGEPGDLAMLAKTTQEAAIFDIPTGFVVYVEGDEEKKGLIGRADLPDAHPLSAVSRGREVLASEHGEATSQKAADALAKSRLQDKLGITRRVTVTHPMDEVRLKDVVAIRGRGVTGPVVQRDLTLGVGAVVTDTVRRIYSDGDVSWL